MNIFVLNKGGSKTGILSNQGANPPAPFFDDLYTQELETGADTYYFSTISNSYTQDLLYVGNKVMFEFGNKQKLFTIASIEYEHKDGQKIIGVYAEGIGFELLDIFMNKPKIQSSGSGSGNDSDGDGDDHLDDEYGDPDDVWIDEDGNIVYIKNNKENGSDYGSPDDVWIDEDGNICYKKNKSKNRDNSSLKLTNISYTKFLNLILKNTGWTYVVDPELDKNKQDMEIRYDTNIYAILQDSMQTYQGVELEFIYEYNNGNIRKVIKAYRNGGRGSITGKRLQYGVNVRGITKLQEIADEKEENIIYDESVSTVNGYRVQLTYDVDIALKSLDVYDMRIGDTYTVIDHEFRPAMQFNARIGKIEISFSDMTRNKCYLANFKKIKGAVSEDEENNPVEDIIKDTIEDYLEDDEEEDDDIGDGDTGGGGGGISAHYYNNNLFKAPRMHSYEFLLYTNLDGDPLQSTNSRTTDYERLDSPINNGEHPTSEDMYNFLMNDTYVYDVSYSVLDNLEHPNIGGDPSNYCLRLAPNGGPGADRPFCLDHDEQDYMGECTMSLAGSRIFSDIINPETDRPDFGDPISADHHDRHMLDVGSLACGLVAALQYHIKNHDSSGSDSGSGSGPDDGSGSGSGSGSDSGSDGSDGDSIYATIEYADYIKDIANSAASKATSAMETAKSASNNVEAYSSLVNELKSAISGWKTNENKINGKMIYQYTIGKEALDHNILTGAHVQKSGSDLPDNQILVTNDLSDSVTDNISNKPASRAAVKKAYDKAVEALNASNGGGGSCDFNKYFSYDDTAYYGANSLILNEPLAATRIIIDGDESNGLTVMGDSRVEISNIYGVDSITFSDGSTLSSANGISTISESSEYATVESLEEEIRAKDAQIATLEARLARLEQHLGLSDDI